LSDQTILLSILSLTLSLIWALILRARAFSGENENDYENENEVEAVRGGGASQDSNAQGLFKRAGAPATIEASKPRSGLTRGDALQRAENRSLDSICGLGCADRTGILRKRETPDQRSG
jgi:hypothetical protein